MFHGVVMDVVVVPVQLVFVLDTVLPKGDKMSGRV
jgi:hypothetical protein